uniref:Glutamyl-tRNA(Gln) amidotransferase subunit C, mitochondrial n=1 Tax=Paramormyrops kingsleyae TaxID=1676925 RepID=A0A3B3QVL5_9TELE|nr:glutamyl-tRNA(Gln) amidotransferase subunit C, mitochondrial [Paramormyrops kingsleyae]
MYCTLGRITSSLQCVALYLRPVRHRCGVYVGPHVVENRGGQNITRHRKKHTSSLSQSQTPHHHNPKVPQTPTWECVREDQLPLPTKVPPDLVDKLERLALLDFRNQDGVDCLEKAIRFADQLHVVNTDGVEPMASVLEDRTLYLRDDRIEEGDCAEQLLGLARNTLEGYYVAPPGNIPLPERDEREVLLKYSEM